MKKTKMLLISIGPLLCAATLAAQNLSPAVNNTPASEPGSEIPQVFERQQMIEARSQASTNTLPVAVEDIRSLSASALGQLLQKLPLSPLAAVAAPTSLTQTTNGSELPEVFERLQMMEARHRAFTNTLPVSLEDVRQSTGSALEQLLQRLESNPAAPPQPDAPAASPAATDTGQSVQQRFEQLGSQITLLSQRLDRLESSVPAGKKNKK